MKHVIESQQFDRPLLEELFALADKLKGEKNGNSLSGKIMASLFYEPSTRTRFSFESAMMRLGGNVLTTENAKEFSSAAKGETLEDTIRIVNRYADIIVIRHHEEGASKRAAAVSEVPIINAGDGPGQHPTQALLDLYTINKEMGHIEDLSVVLVGDLKNGRAARSLVYLLGKFANISITFVAPPALAIGADIKEYLERHNVAFTEVTALEEIVKTADVIYMTRIQKERFPSEAEYLQYKGNYILTSKDADKMKKGAIIMHPLPRVDEIDSTVDSSPHARYFEQAGYGVAIRQALLMHVLS